VAPSGASKFWDHDDAVGCGCWWPTSLLEVDSCDVVYGARDEWGVCFGKLRFLLLAL